MPKQTGTNWSPCLKITFVTCPIFLLPSLSPIFIPLNFKGPLQMLHFLWTLIPPQFRIIISFLYFVFIKYLEIVSYYLESHLLVIGISPLLIFLLCVIGMRYKCNFFTYKNHPNDFLLLNNTNYYLIIIKQLSQYHILNNPSFPTDLICYLCHILSFYICMVLFLVCLLELIFFREKSLS